MHKANFAQAAVASARGHVVYRCPRCGARSTELITVIVGKESVTRRYICGSCHCHFKTREAVSI